jgi:hypothetical protein
MVFELAPSAFRFSGAEEEVSVATSMGWLDVILLTGRVLRCANCRPSAIAAAEKWIWIWMSRDSRSQRRREVTISDALSRI